jgi:hypothetical protein
MAVDICRAAVLRVVLCFAVLPVVFEIPPRGLLMRRMHGGGSWLRIAGAMRGAEVVGGGALVGRGSVVLIGGLPLL